jgi:hypothetical protein
MIQTISGSCHKFWGVSVEWRLLGNTIKILGAVILPMPLSQMQFLLHERKPKTW